MYNGFQYVPFDEQCGVFKRSLPGELMVNDEQFLQLWSLHPNRFVSIFLHGRDVKLPRWQQAYGHDYYFSGKQSVAEEIPEGFKRYLNWAKAEISRKLNGILVNWYDADLNHYIGPHRDSANNLIKQSVIVMISIGTQRLIRFRSVDKKIKFDFNSIKDNVIIMPLLTNQYYKHEVPNYKKNSGKRISITLRCFKPQTQRGSHEYYQKLL